MNKLMVFLVELWGVDGLLEVLLEVVVVGFFFLGVGEVEGIGIGVVGLVGMGIGEGMMGFMVGIVGVVEGVG